MTHISQFYSCSEVRLACELYYICELGKYSYKNYGKPISLDGVILNSCLSKSVLWEHFRLACDEGWLVDTNVSEEGFGVSDATPLNVDKQSVCNYLYTLDEVQYDKQDSLRRHESADYDVRTPIKLQVSFEFTNDQAWKWSINGYKGKKFSVNNRALNHNLSHQAWLSMIAFVAVERLYTGHPDILGIIIDNNMLVNQIALTYVMILADETQALTGWCHYALDDTITENTRLQMGYMAWYMKGKDLGYLDRWYSGAEKYALMQKLDLRVGDLVMFYERNKAQRMNYIKSIAGCHLAKITSLNKDSIEFELINTVKPYYQGKEDFDNHTTIVKKLYNDNPQYEKLNTSKRTFYLSDIGVSYFMHTEKYFIVPLDVSDDTKKVRVSDGARVDTLILSQNDLVYWILKDYNYNFNEDRFLKRYFKNSEPAYTRYMRGEELEKSYYSLGM